MKAAVYNQYGPPEVLRIVEVEKPLPGPDQVLVRVLASSINAADYRLRRADPFLIRLGGGLWRPRDPRLGIDFAGRIEAVGQEISGFQPGDEIFGGAHGAFAEYVCARLGRFARKPANITFAEAASVPVAAITALQGLRHAGGVQPGQQVLIQGASGGVGLFAVQLAKANGAEVTAVCSTRNLELVRSSGADHLIDYTREDFTRNSQHYDLILAVNGYHPLPAYKRCLKPQGVYVCAGGSMPQIFQAMLLGGLLSEKGGRRLTSMGIADENQADLEILAGLLEEGKISPLIDRTYPLGQIVEAMRYVEGEHAQGKVVISIGEEDQAAGNQDRSKES